MKERQKKQKLKRIAEIFSTFIHAPEKFDALFAAVHKDNKLSKALVEEIELHDRRLSDHDQKISDIENADPDFGYYNDRRLYLLRFSCQYPGRKP